MGRLATVGVALIAAAMSLGTTAGASAASLELSVAPGADAGEPLAIVATGFAGTARQRLFLYVEAGGFCGGTPHKQALNVPAAVALTGNEGVALAAEPFERTFSYTPPINGYYSLCSYLDESSEGVPAAYAGIGFSVPEGVVPAPPLTEAVVEELRQFAREYEEELERLKLVKEREEAERPPVFATIATEAPHPEPPPMPRSLPVVRCVVPALRGHSLTAARRLLRGAHCALGGVRQTRARRRPQIVTAQHARHGTVLAAGSPVSVVLGPAHR
jgi:hypothetical protein